MASQGAVLDGLPMMCRKIMSGEDCHRVRGMDMWTDWGCRTNRRWACCEYVQSWW